MKQWYQWFYLALCFAVAGTVSCFERGWSFARFIPVILTVALAFAQLICDKRGDNGKRIFKFITFGLIIIFVVIYTYLIVDTFR